MRKRGKKFGTLNAGKYYGDVEIRFDSHTSTFFTKFIGKEFEDMNLNKVKKAIVDEAKSREKTTWEPVLLIDFNPMFRRETLSGFSVDRRLLGTCKYPTGDIERILAHYSNNMHDDDSDASTWEPIYPQSIWNGDTEKRRIIPYSAEKYNTLKLIENKLREFKAKLLKIISGDECEEFIEFISKNETKFLPPPSGFES